MLIQSCVEMSMSPVLTIEPDPSVVVVPGVVVVVVVLVVVVVVVVDVVVVVVAGFPGLQPGNSSLQMQVYPVSSASLTQFATAKSHVL